MDTHVFQGLRRDNHPINQDSKFLWDAHNIRLTARDGNSQLSITNEKSTKELYNLGSGFNYLGHTVVGDWLVLFVTSTSGYSSLIDAYIYSVNYDSLITVFSSDTIEDGNYLVDSDGALYYTVSNNAITSILDRSNESTTVCVVNGSYYVPFSTGWVLSTPVSAEGYSTDWEESSSVSNGTYILNDDSLSLICTISSSGNVSYTLGTGYYSHNNTMYSPSSDDSSYGWAISQMDEVEGVYASYSALAQAVYASLGCSTGIYLISTDAAGNTGSYLAKWSSTNGTFSVLETLNGVIYSVEDNTYIATDDGWIENTEDTTIGEADGLIDDKDGSGTYLGYLNGCYVEEYTEGSGSDVTVKYVYSIVAGLYIYDYDDFVAAVEAGSIQTGYWLYTSEDGVPMLGQIVLSNGSYQIGQNADVTGRRYAIQLSSSKIAVYYGDSSGWVEDEKVIGSYYYIRADKTYYVVNSSSNIIYYGTSLPSEEDVEEQTYVDNGTIYKIDDTYYISSSTEWVQILYNVWEESSIDIVGDAYDVIGTIYTIENDVTNLSEGTLYLLEANENSKGQIVKGNYLITINDIDNLYDDETGELVSGSTTITTATVGDIYCVNGKYNGDVYYIATDEGWKIYNAYTTAHFLSSSDYYSTDKTPGVYLVDDSDGKTWPSLYLYYSEDSTYKTTVVTAELGTVCGVYTGDSLTYYVGTEDGWLYLNIAGYGDVDGIYDTYNDFDEYVDSIFNYGDYLILDQPYTISNYSISEIDTNSDYNIPYTYYNSTYYESSDSGWSIISTPTEVDDYYDNYSEFESLLSAGTAGTYVITSNVGSWYAIKASSVYTYYRATYKSLAYYTRMYIAKKGGWNTATSYTALGYYSDADAFVVLLTDAVNGVYLSINNSQPVAITYKDGEYTVTTVSSGDSYIIDDTIYTATSTGWETSVYAGDAILRADLSKDSISFVTLYAGNLGFSDEHPIQAISDYESELVQKVYWIDGINQPRVINVTKPELLQVDNSDDYSNIYTDAPFNFVQELALEEEVEIKRTASSSGLFAAGTIQYAFTYAYKYGQETNIFYTSELLYTSYSDRGASAEDTVGNAFSITIGNIDTKFDYVRIYSIQRTSLNGEAITKRVADVEIGSDTTITYTDTGTTGESIDSNYLLYLGGKNIIAQCLHAKDNVLFLGNIAYDRRELLKEDLSKYYVALGNVSIGTRTLNYDITSSSGFYRWFNQLSQNSSTFKGGEVYRLGIQFQYKTGEWSQPIYVDDVEMNNWTYDGTCYRPHINYKLDSAILTLPTFKLPINFSSNYLYKQGYRKVRAVIVFPEMYERNVLAQGILCPTVFNVKNRLDNNPFGVSSWFLRPSNHADLKDYSGTATSINTGLDGSLVEWRHFNQLICDNSTSSEIQNMALSEYEVRESTFWQGAVSGIADSTKDQAQATWCNTVNLDGLAGYNNRWTTLDFITQTETTTYGLWFVDRSLITLHSPDLLNENSYWNSYGKTQGFNVRIVGVAQFDSCYGDISIQLSSVQADPDSQGVITSQVSSSSDGGKGLVSGLFYTDGLLNDSSNAINLYQYSWREFLIYPWHRSGSLNNDINRSEDLGTQTAVLDKKIISNIRYSDESYWYAMHTSDNAKDTVAIDLYDWDYFNSDDVSLIKLAHPLNESGSINYYGNVDTLNVSYAPYKIATTALLANSSSRGAIKYTANIRYLYHYPSIGKKESRYKSDDSDSLTTTQIGDIYDSTGHGTEGVRIKYKSTPHIVFTTDVDDTGYTCQMLPYWNSNTANYVDKSYTTGDVYPVCGSQYWTSLYKNNTTPLRQTTLNIGKGFSSDGKDHYNKNKSNLWIGELYREDEIENRFGGTSNEALQNNQWLPAGPTVSIPSSSGTVTVEWYYGDTWYQRYDCLKTYPYNSEDENQMVEIGSFMCETHLNMDGRYDRNRGLVSNLNVTNENFNLINTVYSQRDNFFTYRIYDSDYYAVNSYPNQIVWTEPKSPLTTPDEWTNLHMANSINLDGTYGKVIAINSFNEILIALQDKAIHNVLFNSRVQVTPTDGVPIEIANSESVEGSRVIAKVGCQDKFSQLATPMGLYFFDNINATIYKYDGQLINLGLQLGSLFWARENKVDYNWLYTSNSSYKDKLNGIRLFYDPKYQDLYFVPGCDYGLDPKDYREVLVYSEQLQQFTSFMNYGGSVLIPYSGHLYGIFTDDTTALWDLFEGEGCNVIFGNTYPYSFSYVSNENPTITKVFDNIELRADLYNLENSSWELDDDKHSHTNQQGKPFNYIQVKNEYQDTGVVNLTDAMMRKKFRIWRAQIPRNEGTRERIRNPWSIITLGNDSPSTNAMILHNLNTLTT